MDTNVVRCCSRPLKDIEYGCDTVNGGILCEAGCNRANNISFIK